jgi:two-component system sensor histidine kinase DegS
MSSDEPSGERANQAASGLQHSRTDDPALAFELQERERMRVGFDLHDGPAQTMSAALLQVKMLESAEGAELHTGLSDLRATLSTALSEIYALIDELGGRAADGETLESRVRACVDKLAASTGIETQLTFEGDSGHASPSLEIAVFRIIQEALSNVRRHSLAQHVDVAVRFTDACVECEIADDGVGFAHEASPVPRKGREHFGLHGMHQRARLLDGDCTISSAPGSGTCVSVRIPVWEA